MVQPLTMASQPWLPAGPGCSSGFTRMREGRNGPSWEALWASDRASQGSVGTPPGAVAEVLEGCLVAIVGTEPTYLFGQRVHSGKAMRNTAQRVSLRDDYPQKQIMILCDDSDCRHSFTQSPTHSLTHSLIHSPTHSFSHSQIDSLTRTITCSLMMNQLDHLKGSAGHGGEPQRGAKHLTGIKDTVTVRTIGHDQTRQGQARASWAGLGKVHEGPMKG